MKPRIALSLIVAAAVAAGVASACGALGVVSDVGNSLTGQVITQDLVSLSWSTNDEGGSPLVAKYKIYRYNCGTPTNCMTAVTTVTATGTCGTQATYTVNDYPPGGSSGWHYSVEIWTNNARAGAVDVTPQ